MDKTNIFLTISCFAIIVATWSGYRKYKQKQYLTKEDLKIELKMTLDGSALSPLDLRVLSGVEERDKLKVAMLITNIGDSPVQITEVGYQDHDLREYASFADSKKILSSGEQVLLSFNDNFIYIKQQLKSNIKAGKDGKAMIFAVTTKGKRFEMPAIIEVAE